MITSNGVTMIIRQCKDITAAFRDLRRFDGLTKSRRL